MKFPPIREGEKRKRIAGKRRRQFSSLEDFSCVRVWWLFRFKRTTKRTRRAKFFSERWISFSLSVKSVKTRTAFLPDLGSVLTYFEGKKEEFWREKTTTKIHHHRFKRLHTTERDSSQISPLLTLSSNTRASQDLFFLANTTRSILQRNDERGRSLSLPRRLPPWRFGTIPEWKKGKAVRESTEKASQKKDPNLRGLPLRASVRRRSRQSFHRARVRICRVRARSARRRRGDRVFHI